MRILYLGDVVGKSGRVALTEHLPTIKINFSIDFVVVCGENAAHGFGITEKICSSFFNSGVDVITLGNHAWDQREIIKYIKIENRLLRPFNYPEGTVGQGFGVYKTTKGSKVAVCQIMGKLFMKHKVMDPFIILDQYLNDTVLGKDVDCIIIDIHGEATSEKTALGVLSDGRASLVVGSHSHVPTSDARILNLGTAYQTDAGMCGPYNSVIGMDSDIALRRFMSSERVERLEPAKGIATLCGVVVDVCNKTGLANSIYPFKTGGDLSDTSRNLPLKEVN